MQLLPCSTENSVLESDLGVAIIQKTLDKVKVMETEEGFYVVVQFRWAGNKDWYLTTRRERHVPKLFKDLKRLNDHLRDFYPTDSFEVFRFMTLPPQGGVSSDNPAQSDDPKETSGRARKAK